MANGSSSSDVFRFVHLKPLSKRRLPGISPQGTQTHWEMQQRKSRDRVTYANNLLTESDGLLPPLREYTEYVEVSRKFSEAARSSDPSVGGFAAQVGSLPELVSAFQYTIERISDALLIWKYSTIGVHPESAEYELLYRALWTVQNYVSGDLDPAVSTRDIMNAAILFEAEDEWFASSAVTGEHEARRSYIRSVGFGDLLVVKQHIKRYEAAEIAHIENVMQSETRSREHRRLDRIEETFITETETTREREEELETAERFELERETSRTISEDQRYGFDLSVSGRYGPTAEFSSDFSLEVERSEESTARNASTYAKDVTERSLSRLKERVRHERRRTVLRETEEKNLHSFKNDNSEHVVGIYQFVDKVLDARVFKYDKRLMFDLMIPEPASYVWHLEHLQDSPRQALPKEPRPFSISAFDIKYDEDDQADPSFYANLAAKYGATEITLPPPQVKTVTFESKQPADDTIVTESGQPRSIKSIKMDIPDGYVPANAVFYASAMTDARPELIFSFQSNGGRWEATNVQHLGRAGEGGVHELHYGQQEDIEISNLHIMSERSQLTLGIVAWETGNYVVAGHVDCTRTNEHLRQWQLETYEKLRTAFQNRMLEYQDELSRVLAEQQQAQARESEERIGAPPSKLRQIMLTELKKHCISVFTRQWYEGVSPMVEVAGDDDAPPRFDLERALETGAFIRFFEQAFEWNQVQYAFYPYYWAQQGSWKDRFNADAADYEYQQFLQAGAARVVIPVRPGFEIAINHYLDTGKIWNGRGAPPVIGSPLYVSIVDEIRESTGGETFAPTPVGEPWEVRLPTNLVLLRRSSVTLPEWQESPPGSWHWEPATETEDNE